MSAPVRVVKYQPRADYATICRVRERWAFRERGLTIKKLIREFGLAQSEFTVHNWLYGRSRRPE